MTVDFNNDIQMSDLNDNDLKKTSSKRRTAKKIIKICRNLRRRKPYEKVSKKVKMTLFLSATDLCTS